MFFGLEDVTHLTALIHGWFLLPSATGSYTSLVPLLPAG